VSLWRTSFRVGASGKKGGNEKQKLMEGGGGRKPSRDEGIHGQRRGDNKPMRKSSWRKGEVSPDPPVVREEKW